MLNLDVRPSALRTDPAFSLEGDQSSRGIVKIQAYDRFNKTYDEIKKTWDSFPEKALYDQKWEELENEAERDLSIEDKRECHKEQ